MSKYESKIVRESGRIYMDADSATSNKLYLYLNTNGDSLALSKYSPRLYVTADSFKFYRFVDIRVTMHATGSGPYAVGFSPSGQLLTTEPTTFQMIYDLPWSTKVRPSTLTIDPVYKLGRSILLPGPVKWFKTRFDSASVDFENQGNFYFVSTGATDAFRITFDYVVEFKEFVSPTNNPVPRRYLTSKEPEPDSKSDTGSVIVVPRGARVEYQ